MNELQKLMGDSYKENLTVDDITAFLTGKNFADLSKGGYVDINKHNDQINNLTKTINEQKQTIKSKMTDEEKAAQVQRDKDAEIEELKKLLAANTLTTNKGIVNNSLVEGLGILGVKSDDKELSTFIDNIVSEDSSKTTAIAQYVNKLIKNAYEKGKTDSTKDAMGKFGKQNGGSDKGEPEIGKLGKELAQASVISHKKFDYFSQK